MAIVQMTSVLLRDGHRARILGARCPMPAEEGAKLAWFLDSAFDTFDKPDIFVAATAKGLFEDRARNDFVWAEIDGQIVSAVWTISPDDDPRIGSLGEVFTESHSRGLGLARLTCTAILDLFDRRGGRCIFLGADNPSAVQIYRELGFVPYPDRLMRRSTPPGIDFEPEWFADGGDVQFREIHWGDMPRLVALYGASNPWISACFPQGFFASNVVRHGRCNSFMKYTWQATRRSLWMGMFSARGALVGSCPAFPRGNEREIIGGEIDLFVHPAFVAHAGNLLRATLSTLKDRGWRWLIAHLPVTDTEKASILEDVGKFSRLAVLPEALSIDGNQQDVIVYRAIL